MLLTGSKALSLYVDKDIQFNDIDIICSEQELNKIGLSFNGRDSLKFENYEFLKNDILNNHLLERGPFTGFFTINGKRCHVDVCSLVDLYVQKRSHIWRNKKFSRHITHLRTIKEQLSNEGIVLNESINKKVKDRIKLTKEKYGDKVPSLNKPNEEFFDDYVTKYYIHDDIHEVMAHYDSPIYTKLKYDDSLALCEKDLWNNLSHEDKIKCVREEAFVIAVERFVIPKIENNEKYLPARITFDKALEKICTTLCSGWFRDFAIDNFFEIRDYKIDFYEKLFNAIREGKLKYANNK